MIPILYICTGTDCRTFIWYNCKCDDVRRARTIWWIDFSLRALWWIEFSLRALWWTHASWKVPGACATENLASVAWVIFPESWLPECTRGMRYRQFGGSTIESNWNRMLEQTSHGLSHVCGHSSPACQGKPQYEISLVWLQARRTKFRGSTDYV